MARGPKPYVRVEKLDGVVTVTAVAAVRNGHRRVAWITESLSDRPAIYELVKAMVEVAREKQQ